MPSTAILCYEMIGLSLLLTTTAAEPLANGIADVTATATATNIAG
jgi:hypothetical protein